MSGRADRSTICNRSKGGLSSSRQCAACVDVRRLPNVDRGPKLMQWLFGSCRFQVPGQERICTYLTSSVPLSRLRTGQLAGCFDLRIILRPWMVYILQVPDFIVGSLRHPVGYIVPSHCFQASFAELNNWSARFLYIIPAPYLKFQWVGTQRTRL